MLEFRDRDFGMVHRDDERRHKALRISRGELRGISVVGTCERTSELWIVDPIDTVEREGRVEDLNRGSVRVHPSQTRRRITHRVDGAPLRPVDRTEAGMIRDRRLDTTSVLHEEPTVSLVHKRETAVLTDPLCWPVDAAKPICLGVGPRLSADHQEPAAVSSLRG
jgi:hypothetical protein